LQIFHTATIEQWPSPVSPDGLLSPLSAARTALG
jgi:hypothetical protein